MSQSKLNKYGYSEIGVWYVLTRAIGQIILLALYPVLQVLGFATSLLDARLHRLWRHVVRHCEFGDGIIN